MTNFNYKRNRFKAPITTGERAEATKYSNDRKKK